MSARARESRIAAIVGDVVAQALRDAGARRLLVLDDGSPQAALAVGWCRAALGDAVEPVPFPAAGDPLLHALGSTVGERAALEVARLRARLGAASGAGGDALVAHPADKTSLLLEGVPPEPLLPLGDLWASQVRELCGAWSARADVLALAGDAGGLDVLDAALMAWIDRRVAADDALARLPEAVRRDVLRRFARGRSARRRAGIVPKLGLRTIGVDLLW